MLTRQTNGNGLACIVLQTLMRLEHALPVVTRQLVTRHRYARQTVDSTDPYIYLDLDNSIAYGS